MGMGVYLSNDIKLTGEESVALHCIDHTYLELLKPANYPLMGCTVDHMPLHHVMVKILSNFFHQNVEYYRWVSVLFSALSAAVLFLWYSRKASLLKVFNALLLTFVVYTGFYFYQYHNFIRVYSLYFLTAVLSLYIFEKYTQTKERKWLNALMVINLIGFLNYFLQVGILFLQFLWLLPQFRHEYKKFKGFLVFHFFIFVYACVKLVGIISWRFVQRGKHVSESADVVSFSTDLLKLLSGEYSISLVTYVLGGLFLSSFVVLVYKSAKSYSSYMSFLIVLTLGSLGTIAFLKFGLKLSEIELRYFIFLLAIFPKFIADAFDSILLRSVCAALLTLVILNRNYFILNDSLVTRDYNLTQPLHFIKRNMAEFTTLPIFTMKCCYYQYYLEAIARYDYGVDLSPYQHFSKLREFEDEAWVVSFYEEREALGQWIEFEKVIVLRHHTFEIDFEDTKKLNIYKVMRVTRGAGF